MSQFGNRLPQVTPQPAAVPDTGEAAHYGRAASVLGDIFGVATQAVQSKAMQIRIKTENREMADKLKVGEVEIEQARLRMKNDDIRNEAQAAHFQNEQQRDEFIRLRDMEERGVYAARSSMTDEQWAQYVAAHPIVDPDLADKTARLIGSTWAKAENTLIYREVSDAAISGRSINVTDLVADRAAKYRSQYPSLHPAAVDEFQNDLLSAANGYLVGQTANLTSERQRVVNGQVLSDISGEISRAFIGDQTVTEMIDRTRDKAILLPGYRGDDGKLSIGAYNGLLAERVAQYADGLIKNPTSNLEQFKSVISQLPKGVRDHLDGYGLVTEINNTIDARARAEEAHQFTSIKEQAVDFKTDANLPGLKMLRDQATNLLKGDVQKRALLDIDTKTQQIMDTRGGAMQIIDTLDSKAQADPDFTPSPDQANKAWNDRLVGQSPDETAAEFVRNGFDVPPDGIELLKTHLKQNPAKALSMIVAIAGASPDRAKDIADSVDKDGLLGIGASVVKDDPSAADSVIGLLSNPQARAAAVKAREYLKEDTFDATAEIANAIGNDSSSPPFVGIPTIERFRDQYTFRFIESAAMGFDPETAKARASQLAGKDVAGKSISIPIPTDERGWQWGLLFSPLAFTGSNIHDRSALVPDSLYGIGTTAKPDEKARSKFESALDEFFDETGNTIPRPDLGFSLSGNSYVPALGQDTRPVAYMEWQPGAHGHRFISEDSPEFGAIDTYYMSKSTPMDRHPLSSLRRPQNSQFRTVAEYDESTGATARFGHLAGMADYTRKRWRERGLRVPVDAKDPAAIAFANDVTALARFLGWDDIDSEAPKKPAEPAAK